MVIEKSLTNSGVSVLMTVYNAELYLKEAIDSIVSQTFDNWELIIVNDGSTDKSERILLNYEDSRIRVFSYSQNIGRTSALCIAFEQARGEYIAILDADDISHPERLAKQVKYLNENPHVGLVGSWAKRIDNNGNVIADFNPPIEKTKLYNSLGWTDPFVHSSVMYRKYLAQQVGGYPKTYVYSQDYAFILNFVKISQVAIMDEYLCRLRIVNSSMTWRKEYNQIRLMEAILLFQKAAHEISLSKTASIKNRSRLALLNFKMGLFQSKEKNKWNTIKFIIEGLKNIILIFV